MKKPKSLILLAAMVLIITCLLPACSKEESPPQKPKSSAGEKPAAPPAAESILSDLDKIIEEIDKMIKMQKNAYLQQSDEKEESQESTGKTNQGSSENNEPNQKSSPSGGDWQKINAGIKNLHNNWNTLEPEAIKAGLTIGSRDNFEQTLNLLTIQASNQDTTESLMAAISLYKYYADLAQVFAMPIPPEFFRVKYEAMSAIGETGRNEWQIAREHILRLQEHWENLKVQAKEVDSSLITCTEFAIHDLEEAIEREQIELVMIKGEIAINNLKKLEEKLSKITSSK